MKIYCNRRHDDTDLGIFKYIAGKDAYIFADILTGDGWTRYWVKINKIDDKYVWLNFFHYPEEDYFYQSHILINNIRVDRDDLLEIKTWQELFDMHVELQEMQNGYDDEGERLD